MKKLLYIIPVVLLFSCFPYVYHDRDEVLIENIDINQTLDIASIELEEGGFDSVLTIWAMRDQIINEEHANRIAYMYFEYIDKLETDFGVWHLSWAIANLYRHGDDSVREALQKAYQDAVNRPDTLKKFQDLADTHINAPLIYMGDFHDMGRAYARSHIVVPGNKIFVQSYDEFFNKKYKNKKK